MPEVFSLFNIVGPFLIFYLYFRIILPERTPQESEVAILLNSLFLNHSCHPLVFYLFILVSSQKNINSIGRGILFTTVFPTSVQHISSSPKILVKLMVQKGVECLEWKTFLFFFWTPLLMYNILQIFKVHSLVWCDICVYQCNYHHNQDNKHIYHSQRSGLLTSLLEKQWFPKTQYS